MRPTPNWGLKGCCNQDQKIFIITVFVCTVVILAVTNSFALLLIVFVQVFSSCYAFGCQFAKAENKVLIHFSVQVEGIKVNADEGGSTITRGGIYCCILPAGYLGSSFWGMILILASTNHITALIATGCFIASLLVVLFVAKNWTLRGLCIGFIIFLAVMWVIQAQTGVRLVRYTILFIGKCSSASSLSIIFLVKVKTSDAEKFAEVCPCCNGMGWGIIWAIISLAFLGGAMYLGLLLMTS
ncbi:hypothetical protein JRO89_XS13G0017100 [Xanthoceras sorbifolium]|uniref:Uncharacterized protein n=1 Tax=Xanthoceras sorbifolium TaxID=99658 RepID=A0ABQ8H5Z7_9ROSI|nr:hypothetical protein JRO89_XS13G0017100 [Xanthoceras sorbifolium]